MYTLIIALYKQKKLSAFTLIMFQIPVSQRRGKPLSLTIIYCPSLWGFLSIPKFWL